MNSIVSLLRREPVRALTVLAGLVPLITNGLIIFDVWSPTSEQLAYVNGAPAAVAVILGFTVVRNAVAPRVHVERVAPAAAETLWPPPQQ